MQVQEQRALRGIVGVLEAAVKYTDVALPSAAPSRNRIVTSESASTRFRLVSTVACGPAINTGRPSRSMIWQSSVVPE
jgi:hypothetical protein